MEEYVRLSSEELRSPLQDERAKFAEKQKVLLEARSKINRGKLNSVSCVTEKALSVFLQSCCAETEKEQAYVANVIQRARATAGHTRSSLEKVNLHAQDLLKSADSDVLELSNNLNRVNSGHTKLSAILTRRESRGRALKARKDKTLCSSTQEIGRAEIVFNKVEIRVDSQIQQFESRIDERKDLASGAEAELQELERETEVGESSLKNYEDEERTVQQELRITSTEYEQLETQLTSRNKAKECAESDQTQIETELIELRESTEKLADDISAKLESIREHEAQVGQLSAAAVELSEKLMSVGTEVQQLEQALTEHYNAAKNKLDDLVQTLESELEEVCNQLATDSLRADIMDKMFGNDVERSPDQWKLSIEEIRTLVVSNNEITLSRDAVLLELETAKAELEKVRQEEKAELADHNMAQSRLRNLKRRIEEEREGMETNMKMADARIAQAMKEMEELTNSKCSDPKDAFVTPNPARHSSLQNLRKASIEASRVISDDSDVESVQKSVIDLPEGIVKRNAATQQCSILRSPDAASKHSAGNISANGGASRETNDMANGAVIDGDITLEGIPLSASIDQAFQADKVENWIRTTPDNNSPASGTTVEMMDNRYPNNIFNETAALNETDMTMDMEDGDLDMSLMEMPPANANKTLSPPPTRQSSAKGSIFVNDSDSDANASVWGDDF